MSHLVLKLLVTPRIDSCSQLGHGDKKARQVYTMGGTAYGQLGNPVADGNILT